MQKKITPQEQKRIFDQWIKDYKGLLFKIVKAYAFNPYDRDDMFQEISVQVWNSIPNYKGDSRVSTWIYRVAFNTAFIWSRNEKKHHQGKREINFDDLILRETTNSSNPQLEWLYKQIAGLNKIERSLILLLLDGYSYKEMAGIMGITENNVGVKISRIKKKLFEKSLEENNGV
jgi:RNA polymerase sigma-70 factor, ECF subfamily